MEEQNDPLLNDQLESVPEETTNALRELGAFGLQVLLTLTLLLILLLLLLLLLLAAAGLATPCSPAPRLLTPPCGSLLPCPPPPRPAPPPRCSSYLGNKAVQQMEIELDKDRKLHIGTLAAHICGTSLVN